MQLAGHPFPASIAMNTIRQVWTINTVMSEAIAGTARNVFDATLPEELVINICKVI
jgi:hypothetical protein